MPAKTFRFWLLVPALTALVLGGCASAPMRDATPAPAAGEAAALALEMLGRPYRYGGAGPQAFDCSGLIQWSYAGAGMRVPRDTDSQRRASLPVADGSLARGDLLFFTQQGKRSSHVAMYLGDDWFVHAPSSGKTVRVDLLADPYWRRHLDEARRFPSPVRNRNPLSAPQ